MDHAALSEGTSAIAVTLTRLVSRRESAAGEKTPLADFPRSLAGNLKEASLNLGVSDLPLAVGWPQWPGGQVGAVRLARRSGQGSLSEGSCDCINFVNGAGTSPPARPRA